MKHAQKHIIFIMILLVFACQIRPQEQFVHTFKYDSSIGSPKATLKSIDWIKGYWKGEAFGGFTEELWSPPIAGSMMCAFKLVVNGKVNFYELVTKTEEKETLQLRLKHFDPKLKGWEEKDKTIDFPLVKVSENRVCFDEFTFERIGPNEMNIYVVIRQKNAKLDEVKFHFIRSTQS